MGLVCYRYNHSASCRPESLVRHPGFEPSGPEGRGVTAHCNTPTLPMTHSIVSLRSVWVAGIEPAPSGFQTRPSTSDVTPSWHLTTESNSDQEVWKLLCYHYTSEVRLPALDSNPNCLIQSQECYRYTNGECLTYAWQDSNLRPPGS